MSLGAGKDTLIKHDAQISQYDGPPEHRAGQSALVRARLDKILDSIIHDFVDAKGRWVPATYIDFHTADSQPDDRKISRAYILADRAWANAIDDWNKDLCIYLCRRRLFDASHPKTPWDPILEKEECNLGESHFPRAPQIIPLGQEIIDRLSKRIRLAQTGAKIRGNHGIHIFRAKRKDIPSSNKA
ncbi:hypothetical protein PFICI_11634 [Pestalotiopsis fici W106-1]|uniref:Uncharacterized protein n=1 Tax=Pestalotiopsis fici (strain W106-1 / CGMCC3.15140) TaxID=1229662 RepID=W3WSZ6_PESFW|nr:uncharacterized protein PFICI_11634 [Pestalotiopsis fici W106-1]ETS76247.1 hypothetical protein PFICI_11634 [Pestalotiopsis fici W106-1]